MKISNAIPTSIVVILSFSAITVLADVAPYTTTQQVLNQSQENWQRRQVQDYNYQYQRFGPSLENIVYPWSVEVRNNVGSYAEDGNHNHILWAVPPTFNDFFTIIQQQINTNAKSIDIEYSNFGFPSSIYIVMANSTVYDVTLSDFVYGSNLQNRRGLISGSSKPSLRGSSKPSRSLQKSSTEKLQELAKYEALWKSKVINNYGYQFTQTSPKHDEYAFPWAVTVRNVVQATGKDGNGNQILWESPKPETMESLFQRIRQAFSESATYIEVQYNTGYGYPRDIYIVYNDQTPDATYSAQIAGFQIE